MSKCSHTVQCWGAGLHVNLGDAPCVLFCYVTALSAGSRPRDGSGRRTRHPGQRGRYTGWWLEAVGAALASSRPTCVVLCVLCLPAWCQRPALPQREHVRGVCEGPGRTLPKESLLAGPELHRRSAEAGGREREAGRCDGAVGCRDAGWGTRGWGCAVGSVGWGEETRGREHKVGSTEHRVRMVRGIRPRLAPSASQRRQDSCSGVSLDVEVEYLPPCVVPSLSFPIGETGAPR